MIDIIPCEYYSMGDATGALFLCVKLSSSTSNFNKEANYSDA